MKLTKIFALILAGCLLCGALIACDNGQTDGEASTETVDVNAPVSVSNRTINLIVKVGAEKKYEGSVTFSGYLGDAIEIFTIQNSEAAEDVACFDQNGLLQTVCDITAASGQEWAAYFETLGKDAGNIPSIKTQGLKNAAGAEVLTEGCTVVLVLE